MDMIIIGTGNRGMTYGTWAVENGHRIRAIAEIREDRRMDAANRLNVEKDMCFPEAMDLLKLEKQAEVAVISTMDRDHFKHTMAALDQGYDILLEKPISPDPTECIRIEEKARALGRTVIVCHVLRYTPFFGTIKQILDSGEIGKIVAIKHSENIGNFHMAHSFVRGNWRNTSLSSPIIMQKSCHDLDILLWLTGAHCAKVAAFGDLTYFKPKNAPAGSSDRCCNCTVRENCRFDAFRAYQPTLGTWPTEVVCLEQTEEALRAALETGPYGRCVFRCDNDVCDHMSIIMEFDNGITATFSLTAQTDKVHRNIHIMCEDGEIIADDSERTVSVIHFRASGRDIPEMRTIDVSKAVSGHGGGDSGIMEDLIRVLSSASSDSRSSISRSVESHLMACAIEASRLTGKIIDMNSYKNSLK